MGRTGSEGGQEAGGSCFPWMEQLPDSGGPEKLASWGGGELQEKAGAESLEEGGRKGSSVPPLRERHFEHPL